MPRLSDLREKETVSRLIDLFDPEGKLMLGDDCAVLDLGSEYLLVTTDITNRGTHFPEGESEYDMGWYAAGINLSDIAAMGGTPLGMLFALAMPSETPWESASDLAKGIRDCCARYSVPVLGGDTKEHDTLTVSGTGVGIVPKRQTLWRKGARPGDIVVLSGQLGRPLLNLRNRASILKIEPRIREGQLLASSGAVTSCIDVSDGLSTSLHHLARAGDVGFEVDLDLLPFPVELEPKEKELALHFGGDYELLFTVDPKKADRVFGTPQDEFTRIGQVTDETGQVSITKDSRSEVLEDRGFEHFSSPFIRGETR